MYLNKNTFVQKIAIISDIHGNLPALNAVIHDIKTVFQADFIYCLGDLTDGAPWNNEVVDIIRTLQIPTVMGNHDERIAFNYEVLSLKKHSVEEQQARLKTINQTKNTISDVNKAFLSKLVPDIRLNLGSVSCLLVHGGPGNNEEYIYEHTDDELFKRLFKQEDVNVIVAGHTHLSFIKYLDSDKGGQRNLFINAGSVGRTKEMNGAKAVYLWLTIDVLQNKVEPVLRKIDYNIGETISGIRNSEVPNFYADLLSKRITQNQCGD